MRTYFTYSTFQGLIAGAIGPIVNCPLDVVKTRLMRQETIVGQQPKYRGTLHAIGLIFKEEGYFALYKGLLPRLARIAPGQAITWTVVEAVENLFLQMYPPK